MTRQKRTLVSVERNLSLNRRSILKNSASTGPCLAFRYCQLVTLIFLRIGRGPQSEANLVVNAQGTVLDEIIHHCQLHISSVYKQASCRGDT